MSLPVPGPDRILVRFIFGLLSALLAFLDLYLAAFIGQQLTARLRNQPTIHTHRPGDYPGTLSDRSRLYQEY